MVAFVVVVGLKLLAASLAVPTGLMASYWVGTSPSGSPERSSDFPWLADATRIDGALDLRGEDFAVHFFNDAARFNFGPDAVPVRDQLPFTVRWQGWLLAESTGERRFVLESDGPARAWLDEAELPAADSSLPVATGLRSLRVEYTRPEARVPRLRLSWQRVPGGTLETVGVPDVRWQANAGSPTLGDVLATSANIGLIAVVAGWIGLGLYAARSDGRARALLGAIPLTFLVYGALLEAPLNGRATILSGLDDWLVYESSARDILLNGLLMDGGQGHAPPFYGQPLYLYALALAHRATGENLFGPLVLQFAALGLVVVATGVLARRAFGAQLDGLAALAAMLVLLQLEPEHFKIARQLFNENLYMPLVMASLIVVVGLARRRAPPVWWQALLAGALIGLTAIARSQFLLWVPFALLVLLLAWRRDRWTAAVLVLGVVLVILPVTGRNWVVSGQLVPISSGAGASLLEFHRPPPGLVDPSALQKDPLFEALHLDQQTRTVLAFIRADPRGYLATLVPLGAHSVGLQGRNDPGVYYPLLLTVLLYLASFVFRRTRALHVWPIHAFVATHLVVLVLFEADTYGYRLVMPMYAPMVACAAQVPLALLRVLVRVTRSALSAPCNAPRATRYAALGWTAMALVALGWQAKGLVDVWPQREVAVHGLGGAAAHAAMTSDAVGASTIYVASVDGTPRRFGAGTLPGLRYPWFKWFDPVRSLPLPPAGTAAVYMLSELNGASLAGDLTACLGSADSSSEVVINADRARQQCAPPSSVTAVTFDGLARVAAVQVPPTAAAGDVLETRLLWTPLVAHPEAQQVSLQLDDPSAGDGVQWGNGTLEVYAARQWQPDETVISRLPVATDPTAVPEAYRLTLGMGPTRPNAQPAMAVWQGTRTDRIPVATVTLTPGSAPLGQALPADMRPVEGAPMLDGGMELIGMRPLPAEAAIGSPLHIGLLWRAAQDRPTTAEVKLRLVRASGEVVQESALPLLGGRVQPTTLRAGNVVRDEQSVLVGPRVPPEELSLILATSEAASPDDPSVRLGSVKLTGRAHTFDSSQAEPLDTFGGAMQLLSAQVEPARVRPGDKLTVKLRWRSAADMNQDYKVFVHVLDSSGQHIVAQRDAEPQDGRAPTTGWVDGEVIDDDYSIAIPVASTSGDYPVEIGVYDPRSGDRLLLSKSEGQNHLVLPTKVSVSP
jgi:4-amino-4-deoxy-L-arabinose transferase-like glycosyltransferase